MEDLLRREGGAIAEAEERRNRIPRTAIRVLAEGCNDKDADSWFMMQVRNDPGL
jgi:hypothetical protein